MDATLAALDRLRLRLRWRNALARASRPAFAAAVAAGGLLLTARLAGLAWSAGPVLGGLAAATALLLLRELLRPFDRRAAAAALDRLLGLDERLSTALEATGPFRELQAADAAAALARATLPRASLPLEGRLYGAALVVLLGLAALPSFRAREDAGEARVRALLRAEAEKLLAAAPDSVDVREAAAALPELAPELAAIRLQALRERLAEKMLSGGAGSAEAARALEAATAAAEGLGAELSGQGRVLHAPSAVVAEAKLRRRLEAPPSVPDGLLPATVRAAALSSAEPDPRYRAIIETYFRGTP